MRVLAWMLVPACLTFAACQQAGDTGADEEVALDTSAAVAEAPPGAAPGAEPGPPQTDDEMIDNAESAAPEAVAREATIVAVDSGGQMRTLRPGSGAFTCLPNNPTTPGNDPMCMDANAMEWLQAYVAKQTPPEGLVGFGYMLQGGSDASNTDPYASEPAPGEEWIDTGPHVMIFGTVEDMQGYPEQSGDASRPYVMWPGTPYAHLMVPVE